MGAAIERDPVLLLDRTARIALEIMDEVEFIAKVGLKVNKWGKGINKLVQSGRAL